MKHIQSCLWSNFRSLPSVYSSDFSRHDSDSQQPPLLWAKLLSIHICVCLRKISSAVQSKTWPSVYLQRKRLFGCCWFWRRHQHHRSISSKQSILCSSFSLCPVSLSCQISIAQYLEKATLVTWKIWCLLAITTTALKVSRGKKKDKNHGNRSEKVNATMKGQKGPTLRWEESWTDLKH